MTKQPSENMLATACRLCGYRRSEHPGAFKDGKCPDAVRGDGRRFAPVKRIKVERVRRAALPGGGPWMILAECPSDTHNSARAAESRKGNKRCICPRGLALDEARLSAWRANYLANGGEKQRIRTAQDPKAPMADLSEAVCRQPWNLKYVDAAFDGNSGAGYKPMKELCGLCPIEQECRQYVKEAEYPAGSWGGVWGGMTPRERLTAFG